MAELQPIRAVETWTCRFALPRPIVLEEFELTHREYVIVRVTTEGGLAGVAYALTRSAPTATVIDHVLTPRVVGQNALDTDSLRDRVERQLLLLGTDGLVERGLSLIDVCCWDIKARAAGLPLWQLLGAKRGAGPALLVDCYPAPGEPPQQIASRLAERTGQGYGALKLHGNADAEVTRSLLEAIREAVPAETELVIDAGMVWRKPREAITAIEHWAPYALAWVEDPFRAEQAESIMAVREGSNVPIAAGDEVASPDAMRRLIALDAVDIVRLDAMCHGGITGLMKLAEEATRRGCTLSAHVYPEIHQHCVFALPALRHLELFAPQTAYDCAEAFLTPSSLVEVENGKVSAPERAGLGIEFDWDAVEAASVD